MMTIEISQLTKIYRNALRNAKPAVDALDLKVEKGEVFGFLGPNGAGKSTVIKILMDFIRPSSGTAKINGIPAGDPDGRRAVGYLPENPFFYDHLTAQEVLSFGGKANRMEKQLISQRTDELLERLKLSHANKQRLRTYSKGMVQRTGLALALIHNPEICILDEPMSGLDPLGRRLVADLIVDMRNNGQTVFFSSHILSDIERVCDRVGILNRGRLLFSGNLKKNLSENEGLEDFFVRLIEKDEREVNGADLAA
jgi:ABC-2 type transport system ATP-binding protein